MLVALAGTAALLMGIGADRANREPPRAPRAAPELPPAPPADTEPRTYFGELHLHTAYSLDAFLFGTRIEPPTAYRFARGEEVWLPESQAWQRLRTPLDFVAVTDHAESLGMYQQCTAPGSDAYWSLDCLGARGVAGHPARRV